MAFKRHESRAIYSRIANSTGRFCGRRSRCSNYKYRRGTYYACRLVCYNIDKIARNSYTKFIRAWKGILHRYDICLDSAWWIDTPACKCSDLFTRFRFRWPKSKIHYCQRKSVKIYHSHCFMKNCPLQVKVSHVFSYPLFLYIFLFIT